jgi:hypothetical protein
VPITYHILFLGGPCNNKRGTITTGGNPPAHVTCRGSGYTLAPAWSAERAVYTYTDSPPGDTSTYVRGQRDVFRAWSALVRTMKHGTERELAAIGKARRRIRRAVR